tara:strand:+ start:1439 stop:2179 length:741 start_codon:yes stop_codon:yes gene_type:complete
MLESWQSFQADFGTYLRDPAKTSLPEGVVPRRAKVYEDLLFNNICSFINTCFPICKSMLTKEEWKILTRDFFRDWRCHSPRFNDIPKEFLDYLASDISPELKYPWLLQLAHYEWVELAVDTFDESGINNVCSESATSISVNPSLQNLIYDWPVHQISPDYIPTEARQTFLLVYRNEDHDVKFTEINAATSALINLFEQGFTNSDAVLSELASQMNVALNHAFNDFGLDMINQLIMQGILHGALHGD